MSEAIVSYKTAKLLKKKGFDLNTPAFYVKEGKASYYIHRIRAIDGYEHLSDRGKDICSYFYEGYYNWNSLPPDNEISMMSGFSESNEERYNIVASAPTLPVLQKWIWETYRMFVEVRMYMKRPSDVYSFKYVIKFTEGHKEIILDEEDRFDTPDQALEAGLYKTLKKYIY